MFKENELDVLESIAHQLKRIADALEKLNERERPPNYQSIEDELESLIKNR